MAAGLLAGALALVTRRTSWSATVVAAAALLALWMGWWQTASVPAVTGPSRLLAVLPLIGLLAALGALAARRSQWLADALVAAAGLELVLWSWRQRAALGRAILPTDVPGWLDRAVITGVGAAALFAAITAAVELAGGGGRAASPSTGSRASPPACR